MFLRGEASSRGIPSVFFLGAVIDMTTYAASTGAVNALVINGDLQLVGHISPARSHRCFI